MNDFDHEKLDGHGLGHGLGLERKSLMK
jgi:hypothetical protein